MQQDAFEPILISHLRFLSTFPVTEREHKNSKLREYYICMGKNNF